MSTNAILGFPSVTELFDLSGGHWQANFPQAALQSLPLSRVARTLSLAPADCVIIATTPTTVTRRVGLIGLARHNCTIDAQIRLRLYSDPGLTTLIYDSGTVDMWQEVYPYDTLEWEDDSYWTGKYSDAELAGTNWLWLWWVGLDYMAAGIRIDISDPTNPAGYVQAGYLEIAGQYQAQFNIKFGARYGFRFRTVLTEALGGAKYADERAKPRTFKGAFDADHFVALAKYYEMVRQRDVCDPILWLPEPDDPINWVRTAFLAQFAEPDMFTRSMLDIDEVPISLEEIIG
jgi:hypothetical protein